MDRRRFQIRLLYLLLAMAAVGIYLACILGHLGFAVQLGALLTTMAAVGGVLFFIHLQLLRLLYIVLPQKIVQSLRRAARRPANLVSGGAQAERERGE